MNSFDRAAQEARKAIGRLTDDISVVMLEHYRAKFDEGGQQWGGVPWELPDRRKANPKRAYSDARRTEAILVESAVLRDSIEVKTLGYGEITIGSDLVYAQVHNEGLHAGRGAGFEMPKRQFLGMEPELEEKISQMVSYEIGRLFKK